ncbi:MAG: sel1 repeat family protein [Gammaproteobacteria bacterium]|nr:sel1 repeat family protein [Gammaproteobacteria bacterium]
MFAASALSTDDHPLRSASQAVAEKDFKKAFELWLPIAERGDPRVQEWIGDLYRMGQGVERSHAEAKRWYKLSAEAGNSEGICSFAHLLSISPDPGVRDGEVAVVWARRCIDRFDVSETRNTLALALAAAGRFGEAADEQRTAISMFRAGNFVRGGELVEHERVYAEQLESFLAREPWFSEI